MVDESEKKKNSKYMAENIKRERERYRWYTVDYRVFDGMKRGGVYIKR